MSGRSTSGAMQIANIQMRQISARQTLSHFGSAVPRSCVCTSAKPFVVSSGRARAYNLPHPLCPRTGVGAQSPTEVSPAPSRELRAYIDCQRKSRSTPYVHRTVSAGSM